MSVLITRSREDSAFLKEELLQGTKAPILIEPMIEVSIEAKSRNLDLLQYDSLIFTSKNAVSYVKQYDYSEFLDKKCFAIGDSTKAALEEIGFHDIHNAHNDIEGLVSAVLESESSASLYFRGETITKDLKEEVSCDEMVCYRVIGAKRFSKDLVEKLQRGEIKTILFFSENTANVFLSLCAKYEIANFLKETTILTISTKLSRSIGARVKTNIKSFEGDSKLLIELINTLYV
jgi:uroporphyrinogen-III synthase